MLRRKTATYALLALYEIASQSRDGHSVGVRAGDIAQKHRLPKAYAAKILSQLANAGILHSDRGPRGGFRLNRSPDTISLFDVFAGVGALDGFDSDEDGVLGIPPQVQDVMDRAHVDAAAKLKELFDRVSLNDLLGRRRELQPS